MTEHPRPGTTTASDNWQEQADEAWAMIARFRDDAEVRGAAAERATARLQSIEVEAWSPRREVRLVLGATALITDIEYAAGATKGSPQSLAREVQAAHDSALRQWHRQVEQATEESLADDPALRDHIRAAAREELHGHIQLDQE